MPQKKKLNKILELHPDFQSSEIKEEKVKVTFNKTVNGDSLNKFLFDNGIIASQLVEVTSSLEDEFLEIVKNK